MKNVAPLNEATQQGSAGDKQKIQFHLYFVFPYIWGYGT